MPVAVLFLLLGVWAAELALFGFNAAPLAGAICLGLCALSLVPLARKSLGKSFQIHAQALPSALRGVRSTSTAQRSATFVR